MAGVEADGTCFCNVINSKDTKRHIDAFAMEYALPLSYKSFKMMYEDNCTINCETGEVDDRHSK